MDRHLELAGCRVDLAGRRVFGDGAPVGLTTKEAELLSYLVARPDQPVSNETLLCEVWGYRSTVVTRAVHNTMRRLRGKVERDPSAPEHLLTEFGVGFRFVPLATAAPPRAAPAPRRTADPDLVGRDEALGEIHGLLGQGRRLITLTGPGGVGKTRLALAVADGRSGPVRVCLAEGARDTAGLDAALARALEIPLSTGDPAARVAAALQALGPAVLVVDNLEQAVDAAAEGLPRWLGAAPDLQILATSRVPLAIADEQVWDLAPLAWGDEARPGPAVALLWARAEQAGGRWEVAAERGAGVRLAQALDGLPLALELAAARARLFTPTGLLAQLAGQLDVFRARERDGPERHRTLRAAIAWSWALLPAEQQRLLALLSLFQDDAGFDAVCAVAGGEPVDVLDGLEDLVHQSLAVARPDAGGVPRVALLASVRLFAADALAEGDEGPAALAALGRWCAAQPARASTADLERVARDCGLDVGVPCGLAALGRRQRVGPLGPARALGLSLLARPGLDPASRGRLCAAVAGLAWAAGRVEDAHGLLDQGLAAVPEGPGLARGQLLAVRGRLEEKAGQVDAARDDWLAALDALGGRDPAESARVRRLLAVLDDRVQGGAAGVAAFDGAVAEARAAGDPLALAEALYRLGFALGRNGRSREGLGVLREAHDVAQALPPTEGLEVQAQVLAGLGRIGLDAGHADEAAAWSRQALGLVQRLGDHRRAAILGHNLAWIDLQAGRPEPALRGAAVAQVGLARAGMHLLAQSAGLAQGIGLVLTGQPAAVPVLSETWETLAGLEAPDAPRGPVGVWLALALALADQPQAAADHLALARAVVAPSPTLDLTAAEWDSVTRALAVMTAGKVQSVTAREAVAACGLSGLSGLGARLEALSRS